MEIFDGKSWPKLAGVLAASLVSGAICYEKFWRKPKTRWEKVGTVDKLYVHALKGGKAREVYSADFGWLGLKSGVFTDRSFMLISESNQAVYSMDEPRIVLVDFLLEDGKFIFRAPDMEDLILDKNDLIMTEKNEVVCRLLDSDIKCVECGKRYNEWFSRFIKGEPTGLKLTYFGEDAERPARPGTLAMFPETYKSSDLTTFNFTTAYHMLTWASVKSLNKQLGFETTPEWYRPNIVISTERGIPYEEENWRKRIRFGNDVVLHFVKECHRCLVITVDPKTGTKNTANLDKLREFRLMDHGLGGSPDPVLQKRRMKAMGQSPFFGINYGIDSIGQVRIGDPVYAEVEV